MSPLKLLAQAMIPKERMSNRRGRFAGFHISIASVLSAFLLVGCIQAAIMGVRYPIAAGVGWFGNWLAGRFHTEVIVFQQTPEWERCALNLVVAVLFFAAFIGMMRRTTRRGNADAK